MTTRTGLTLTLAFSLSFFVSALVHSADRTVNPSQAKKDAKSDVLWFDAKDLTIEGLGFDDLKSPYDRLPKRAEKNVRSKVWSLSRDSAGVCVRFETDATEIHARWTLTSDRLAMVHMPATGVSGLDLYVQDEKGIWRWLNIGRPSRKTNQATLISGLPAGRRNYMLYLPLYNGVTSVEVGIPQSSSMATGKPRPLNRQKPIVFYGTSITHGACASRTGMVHTAILGRRLHYPVINLGFSGNGRFESEVVEYIAEIDAAMFVIDCLPNVDANTVLKNTKPCVVILRKKYPKTPIVLVEDRSYANSYLQPAKKNRNETSRAALRKVYQELIEAGDKNLYYIEGENLLGNDNEGTVDSSHPTDLGFMRQADAFAEVIGPILNRTEAE